jgi:hypothetical protein
MRGHGIPSELSVSCDQSDGHASRSGSPEGAHLAGVPGKTPDAIPRRVPGMPARIARRAKIRQGRSETALWPSMFNGGLTSHAVPVSVTLEPPGGLRKGLRCQTAPDAPGTYLHQAILTSPRETRPPGGRPYPGLGGTPDWPGPATAARRAVGRREVARRALRRRAAARRAVGRRRRGASTAARRAAAPQAVACRAVGRRAVVPGAEGLLRGQRELKVRFWPVKRCRLAKITRLRRHCATRSISCTSVPRVSASRVHRRPARTGIPRASASRAAMTQAAIAAAGGRYRAGAGPRQERSARQRRARAWPLCPAHPEALHGRRKAGPGSSRCSPARR